VSAAGKKKSRPDGGKGCEFKRRSEAKRSKRFTFIQACYVCSLHPGISSLSVSLKRVNVRGYVQEEH
jgi:hypothetical protein